MSEEINQLEQVPLIKRQIVWENQSSGTSSPDKETPCLRKSIKRIHYHASSPPVIYSQMSIISIKAKEKCIVYKLRSLKVLKAFNHDTTVPQFNSKIEVLKPYWVK